MLAVLFLIAAVLAAADSPSAEAAGIASSLYLTHPDEGEEQTELSYEQAEEMLSAELKRQADELELAEWQRYFEACTGMGQGRYKTVGEMLLHYAEHGADASPQSIWELLIALLKAKANKLFGPVAAITSGALMTCLAGVLPDKGMRKTLALCLGAAPVLLTASAFTALCSEAFACMESFSGFTRAALPVMTTLLSAVGATASAGAMRPLMLFLSGTVVMLLRSVIMPLIFAAAAVGVADSLGGRARLSELFKLILKTVKWLIGIISILYFGICSVQGMTVSAADGISVRTAKYAVDKLLPSMGGLIGGSLDTFMSCALLIKNGAGISAIVIMLGLLIEPLASIGAGVLVFRISAALCRPAAEPGMAALLSNIADTAALLLGVVTAAGAMFAVIIMVFITAGGISAGLW